MWHRHQTTGVGCPLAGRQQIAGHKLPPRPGRTAGRPGSIRALRHTWAPAGLVCWTSAFHAPTYHRFVERAGGHVHTHTRTCVSRSHTPHPPGTLRASGKESEDFPGPLHVVSGTPPSLSPPCPPPPLPSPSPALEKGGCPLHQSVLRPPTQFTSQREQDTPLCLQPPCCPGLATGEASSGIKVAPCAWTQTLASGWSPGFKPWPHPPIASRVNPKQNSNTCEPPFGCVSTSQRHA